MDLESGLYSKLAAASLDYPATFAERALAILVSSLDLKAASFYSYSSEGESLTLRGQIGLEYDLYKSFELPLETPAGRAVTLQQIVHCDDVSKENTFRDKALIERFRLKQLVATPLFEQSAVLDGPQRAIGVICIYLREGEKVSQAENIMRGVAPFIARLYRSTFERLQLHWREKLVDRVSQSHDTSGVTMRAASELKKLLAVEAVTVFLLDDRNGFLRMRGTTASLTGEAKAFYLQRQTRDITYQAFAKGTLYVLNHGQFVFPKRGVRECLDSEPKHCVIAPLLQYNKLKGSSRFLGAIRVFNHRLTLGGVTHRTAFGWEEIHLVRFFAEMLSVLVHFMKKGANAEDDFTRSMHGAKHNLQASINYLDALESVSLNIPAYLNYAVSDSLSFLTDISSQIQRLELRHRHTLDIVRVKLYGEILSKIPPMIKRSAHAYGVGKFEVELSEPDNPPFDVPHTFPLVKADLNALFCVFRNLAENAVKYCREDKDQHRLKFQYKVDVKSVKVYVMDWGMGIPRSVEDDIFVEGFRTDSAINRHPSSNGVGLADSKELMIQMQGEIKLVRNSRPTVFEVTIPRA